MADPTYKLNRIVDLLQVPSERRAQCVKELLLGLEFAEFCDGDLSGPLEWTDDGDSSCTLFDQTGADIAKLVVTNG